MGILDTPAMSRKQATSIPPVSLYDRLSTEGLPWSNNTGFTGTAANNTSIGSLYLPGLSKAFWVENAVISSNKNAVIQLGLTSTYLGGAQFPNLVEVITAPGVPVILPLKQFLRPMTRYHQPALCR